MTPKSIWLASSLIARAQSPPMTRLVESFLLETQPNDPGTLALVGAVLLSASAPRFSLAMRRQGERPELIRWRLCGTSKTGSFVPQRRL